MTAWKGLERHAENPTRKTAIEAKCWDCQGGDADPAVFWRIGNCPIPACALYPFRPFRHKYGKGVPLVLQSELHTLTPKKPEGK